MSASLPEIRAALAARLAAEIAKPGSGIEAYAKMLNNPAMPCFVVPGPNDVEYHVTSEVSDSGTGARYQVLVMFLANAGIGDEAAQDELDPLISDVGETSVRQVLEADPSLGGIVDDVIVRSCSGYAFYVIGGVDRLGADWLVDVYT